MTTYMVVHATGTFFLRGTVWTSDIERAAQYLTKEAAQAAIDKAKKFNPKGVKGAVIQPVEVK